MSRHSKHDRAWHRMAAIVKRDEPLCWICGQLIDPTLRYPDPYSFSCDHVVPASVDQSLAMERSNVRASHLVCNQRRGDGRGGRRLRSAPQGDPRVYRVEDI